MQLSLSIFKSLVVFLLSAALFSTFFLQLNGINIEHFPSLLSQDLPNAMNAADITEKLGLHSMRNREWYIQATCATDGAGLYEGLDWLSNALKSTK